MEELNRQIKLSLRIELNERSVLIIYSASWVVCMFISPLAPLRPLVGLRPPSNPFIFSIDIWHDAGATKFWSSVVSVFCSCLISVCIWSNYDCDGWASRIIHLRLLVFSTVLTTLIWQETISLAVRNHSFWLQIEGRLTFRDISTVVIRTQRVNLLHRLFTKCTHQRNWKRSLFQKDRRTFFLTHANKEGIRQWVWQASISFSWLIQSSYSVSSSVSYPLPFLAQDTMRCCLESIFISDPVFEGEWATTLFRWKLVDRWIGRGSFLRLHELSEEMLQLRTPLARSTTEGVPNVRLALTSMDTTF